MSNEIRVIGIDLASGRWADNGSAILSFTADEPAKWTNVEYGCIKWPNQPLTASAMAETIERAVTEYAISAVCLDGPQGWREPNAGKRPGVGRVCEYKTRCQGKTGEFGRAYPQTQHGWIRFCIEVFAQLVNGGRAKLANDPEQRRVGPLDQERYWLLECFPTSTWRASRLPVLPGKRKFRNNSDLITQFASALQQRYQLPRLEVWDGAHDDLQAIVAALPAAGLLGGPCVAVPHGKPARNHVGEDGLPDHLVEGLIWDAALPEHAIVQPVNLPVMLPQKSILEQQDISGNRFLTDDRDDQGEKLLERGIQLFRYLAQQANLGRAIGVGYAQLVCCVHQVERFSDVAGRNYATSDTAGVVQLAHQITAASGGKIPLTRDGVTINAGMDSFVWRETPPHPRPDRGFDDAEYSQDDWKTIFPDGHRRLLNARERRELDMTPTAGS